MAGLQRIYVEADDDVLLEMQGDELVTDTSENNDQFTVQTSRKKRFGGGGRRYSVKERQDMNLSYLQSLPSNSLVVLDNDSTWRSVFVQLLERSLSPAHVQGLPISTQNIIFNMTHVSPKGVVQV